MSEVPFETLLESSRFPVSLVSEKSAGEKAGGGRPPYWEMVFWWTRKPLISARAIIAGALVPSSVNVNEFCRVLRLMRRLLTAIILSCLNTGVSGLRVKAYWTPLLVLALIHWKP